MAKYEPERGSFKTYCVMMAWSRALSLLKKQGRMRPELLPVGIEALGDSEIEKLMEEDLRQALEAGIAQLEPDERELINRSSKGRGECTLGVVAEDLGVSIPTASRRLAAAKLKLRKYLESRGLTGEPSTPS